MHALYNAPPSQLLLMCSSRLLSRCKKIDAGVHEPLPVAAIQSDAANTHVPVYEYPFLHEQLYAWGAARAQVATHRVISRVPGAMLHACCCSTDHQNDAVAEHQKRLQRPHTGSSKQVQAHNHGCQTTTINTKSTYTCIAGASGVQWLQETRHSSTLDEELPPWPRHWRNWKTITDEHGLLSVVRPQQLEVPAVLEGSEEELSFETGTEREYSDTGVVPIVLHIVVVELCI